MFESTHKLRHLPFFEAVASGEEREPGWRAATAGLVVLRLVDAWLEDGAAATDSEWAMRSVRASIEAMDDGTPIKSILFRVVAALEEQRPDIHVVVTPLMAYGRALEYDAKWFLAADVYHSVLAHLHPAEDADASVAAHLRLGQCYRTINRLDEATTAFSTAFEVATSAGDVVGVLRARIGDAQIAILRGNLPSAEKTLDETIRGSVGPEMKDVRSRALHDRSSVAVLRGDYELAIRLGYEAMGHSQSASERDRILFDLAGAFSHLGVYSAARDAYVVVMATAQEQYMRWAASINLLEVSSRTGAEVQFELYRRQLAEERLPPFLGTAYHLAVGLGYKRLGDARNARKFLERALALAGEHGLNQFVFEAEDALKGMETTPPPRSTPASVSLDVEEVAEAINQLRQTAGV